MKKNLCLAFLAFLLLFSPFQALASEGIEKAFTPESAKALNKKSVFLHRTVYFNNSFYGAYIDGAIYGWKPGDNKPSPYASVPPWAKGKKYWRDTPYKDFKKEDKAAIEEAVDSVAAGDGALWGYNLRSGKIGRISKNGIAWNETRLDTSFLWVGGSNIRRFESIRTSFVQDGKLYIFVEAGMPKHALSTEPMTLICFDIKSGTHKLMPTQNGINLCLYKPGFILLTRQGDSKSMHLSKMNLKTGEIEDLPPKIPFPDLSQGEVFFNQVGGLAWDEKTNQIFFMKDDTIYRSKDNQPFEKAGSLKKSLDKSYASMLAWILPDGRYALKGPEGLYVFKLD